MDTIAHKPVNISVYTDYAYEGNLTSDRFKSVESIDWQEWIEVWLNSLSPDIDRLQDCELGLRLTGDRQIQALNDQYRALDRPTDVLAFAATEADLPIPIDIAEPLYLGDIIISIDTAVIQAKSQNHSLTMELAWLASHGVLHLLGWDHPDDVSLQEMLQQQSELIQLLNISNV